MLITVDSSLLTKPNLNRFWNLAESPLTSDDNQVIDHFNKTVQFTEGRYMVTRTKYRIYPKIISWQSAALDQYHKSF